ncbi:MAG TPA: protein-methionine-sulfoxide reductase catalytic subunit MsrP [Steroidobacteraceae bacterium]|nr:protein-methionine-sulfoxide reductase catalytic subunit MsrP [Steroidobacteraceae bacterium]
MRTRLPHIAPSEITPESVYLSRRALLAGLLAGGATSLVRANQSQENAYGPLTYSVNPMYTVAGEQPNKFEEIAGYNNFYEFGTDKDSPSEYAPKFLKSKPWSVIVGGECEVKGTFNLEDLLKGQTLEERIYRFRCVEAWSLVVPWVGFPLSNLITRFKPTANAKYVQFTTLYDPSQMPGQRDRILNWPYVEGLRMDEAMHPLTLMVVGLYGRVLPNQDGAPLRLIVPWKYGFKSCKSIARIDFTAREPRTAWNLAAPNEYGFYANVNPKVDHPRWSQATERRIGAPFLAARRPTLPFNGYADQVASLYQGLDLKLNF